MNLWKRLIAAAFLILASGALAFGKKDKLMYAPLPSLIFSAHTVYIDNETGDQSYADKAYTQLVKWGRLEVVNDRSKADLILSILEGHSHTSSADVGWASLYNSKTGAWTSGTVPGGTSELTWTWTQMKLTSPKITDVLWADQQLQRGKHSATEWLIVSLRQRIDAQEKSSHQ